MLSSSVADVSMKTYELYFKYLAFPITDLSQTRLDSVSTGSTLALFTLLGIRTLYMHKNVRACGNCEQNSCQFAFLYVKVV